MSRKYIAVILIILCLPLQLSCAPREISVASQDRANWLKVDPAGVSMAKETPAPSILPRTHFAAGQLLESQGDLPDAAAQYQRAILLNHNYIAAYHRLALIQSRLGDHATAIVTLKKAVEIKPSQPMLYNNLGYEYALIGDWDPAEENLRKAIELDPGFSRAYINLAMVLCRVDRFDEAHELFRTVLPDPAAWYNLAMMYCSRKMYREAGLALHKALQLDPNFVAAKSQLVEISKRADLSDIWPTPERTVGIEGALPRQATALTGNVEGTPIIAVPLGTQTTKAEGAAALEPASDFGRPIESSPPTPTTATGISGGMTPGISGGEEATLSKIDGGIETQGADEDAWDFDAWLEEEEEMTAESIETLIQEIIDYIEAVKAASTDITAVEETDDAIDAAKVSSIIETTAIEAGSIVQPVTPAIITETRVVEASALETSSATTTPETQAPTDAHAPGPISATSAPMTPKALDGFEDEIPDANSNLGASLNPRPPSTDSGQEPAFFEDVEAIDVSTGWSAAPTAARARAVAFTSPDFASEAVWGISTDWVISNSHRLRLIYPQQSIFDLEIAVPIWISDAEDCPSAHAVPIAGAVGDGYGHAVYWNGHSNSTTVTPPRISKTSWIAQRPAESDHPVAVNALAGVLAEWGASSRPAAPSPAATEEAFFTQTGSASPQRATTEEAFFTLTGQNSTPSATTEEAFFILPGRAAAAPR